MRREGEREIGREGAKGRERCREVERKVEREGQSRLIGMPNELVVNNTFAFFMKLLFFFVKKGS